MSTNPEPVPKVISRSLRVADLGAIVTAMQDDFIVLNATVDVEGRAELAAVDPHLVVQSGSGRPATALLNRDNFDSLASTCRQAAEARMPVGFVAEHLAAGKPRVLDATVLPIFEDEDATRCRYFLCTARDVASDFYRMVVSNDGLPGIAGELAMALNREEFEIWYEPVFEVRSGRMIGCRAGLRWRHPERGLLEASEFVAVAEQTRQINEIGEWLLWQACQDASEWNQSADGRRTALTVTVSAVQVRSGAALRSITAALSHSGLDPTLLTVAVPAAALVGDRGDLPALLGHLGALGVKIRVDGAGLAYKALRKIKEMNGQTIGVDADLLAGVGEGEEWPTETLEGLVHAIQPVGLVMAADGVSTPQQAAVLKQLGFETITGRYCGTPMTAEECAHYVTHASEIPLH